MADKKKQKGGRKLFRVDIRIPFVDKMLEVVGQIRALRGLAKHDVMQLLLTILLVATGIVALVLSIMDNCLSFASSRRLSSCPVSTAFIRDCDSPAVSSGPLKRGSPSRNVP